MISYIFPMLTWITQTPSHVSFLTYISHCMPTWITDTLITFIKSYVSMLTWINKAPLYPNFYLTHADEGLCTTGGNCYLTSSYADLDHPNTFGFDWEYMLILKYADLYHPHRQPYADWDHHHIYVILQSPFSLIKYANFKVQCWWCNACRV